MTLTSRQTWQFLNQIGVGGSIDRECLERQLEEMETRDALLYAKTTTEKFAECAKEDTATVGGFFLPWCFLIIQPFLVLPCLARWLLCIVLPVIAVVEGSFRFVGSPDESDFGNSSVRSSAPGFFAVVLAAGLSFVPLWKLQ
ncbi:hypothetical protein Ancab_004601 [Ancistrocladus abbreviatus]